MQDKILSKFNVYDHFGYILVGAISLLVTTFNLYLFNKQSLIPSFDFQNFILWLMLAYLLGHVFQAIANIFIKENKTEFSEVDKDILNEAIKYFGVKTENYNQVYSLCYLLATSKDISGQVQSFNAYYSLYRGWFVVFLMETIFFFVVWQKIPNNSTLLILGFISLMIATLFYKRSKRFYEYSRAKTLQTFLIVKKLKL